VVHLRARRVTTDLELGGVAIAAGERVIAVNASANRDPARWDHPDTIDPGRARARGHLAFSVGPRHCAGAHLARMEATEVIGGLFRAFPDLARVPDAAQPVPMGSPWSGGCWFVHAPIPCRTGASGCTPLPRSTCPTTLVATDRRSARG
jgi:cytochrome P450